MSPGGGAAGGPSADVSVRVAWSDDAPAIAVVQLRAWPKIYSGIVPASAFPNDMDALTGQWHAALTRPGDARNRVLVALERNRVVGIAVNSPSNDPDADPFVDGELCDLFLDPAEVGKGHGSRLLQAAVDTLAADRFTRAVTWVLSTADEAREFLEQAGWAPDTAHRELDLDGSGLTTVKQIRLHTAIGS